MIMANGCMYRKIFECYTNRSLFKVYGSGVKKTKRFRNLLNENGTYNIFADVNIVYNVNREGAVLG